MSEAQQTKAAQTLTQPATGTPTEPEDVAALQELALQEGESGNSDQAIRDYEHVLSLRPDWKEGWWNLGTLQYSANQYTEAQSTLRKVVGFAPDFGIAWALLGLSEFETKDFADSLTHLEKAHVLGIKEDAETERVSSYHLALLLIRHGDFDGATELLRRTFVANSISPPISAQVTTALGLAMLRVPLLPEQVNPSQEALLVAAGGVAAAGRDAVSRFPAFIENYRDVPYLHYAYGMALARAGRDKESIQQMREEMKVSPESSLPWVEISRAELRMGAAQEALAAARKAVSLTPADKAAHEVLAAARGAVGETGTALDERKWVDRLIADQPPPEQRIVLRYGNLTPGKFPIDVASQDRTRGDQELWNRAMQEYSTGQHSAAAADLAEWLRKSPDNGTGWAVLGLNEFALGAFENALIHLERGEKLGLSGSAESLQSARYTLGILLIRASEFDRASEVLASAMRAGPLDGKVQYALGLALLRIAKFPEQLNQQQAGIVSAAGKIAELLHESKYDAAFPLFQELLKHNPSTPFLHYTYGTALLALSQFGEAAAQMRAEIPISPASELPYIRLASIALREHNFKDALTSSGRAVQLAPNSAEAHYLLGRAALDSGDDATAVQELELASRISPGSPEVHFNLARAYARSGMPEKANRERAAFARLNDIAEVQRSRRGSQAYEGPRDAGDVTVSQPDQGARSPSGPL